jgi:hypothetical protein
MRWRPNLTPGRRRYLEQLADGLPRRIKQRGPVGFSLRQLGWCSFAVRDLRTGEVVPLKGQPFYNEDGVKLYEFLTDPWDGAEIITPEGLRVLSENPTPEP